MPTSTSTTGRVREHFRAKAFSFDHLYDEDHALQRLLRPGLFNRRELALTVAAEHEAPSVLDVPGKLVVEELELGHALQQLPDQRSLARAGRSCDDDEGGPAATG